MALLFNEKQKFNQWFVWIPLLFIACIPLYGIYVQIVKGIPFGDKPATNNQLFITLVITLLLILFIFNTTLTTIINAQKIKIKFWPFTKKSFSWTDIDEAKVIDYGFIGGWGLRLHTKYGTVYNVKGKMGLYLRLKNGEKYCIGTQKPEELKAFMKAIKINNDG